MKIAITGGCGYLGTLLSSRLSDGDRHVDILDVRTPSVDTFARLPSTRFTFRRLDVGDAQTARSLLGRYDVIVHLAGLSSIASCEAEPERAERSNILTTENVLRFRKPGARLLFLSTMAVYGTQCSSKPIDETCDVTPDSVFAKTKSAAEFLVRGQKDSVILRSAENFGFSPAMRHDLTVHRILRDAREGEALKLSQEDRDRPLIHSQDTVESIVYCLSHWGRVQGELYNVGNPGILLNELQLEGFLRGNGRGIQNALTHPRFSYQKLRGKGLLPQRSLAEGIEELLPYYRKNENLRRMP